VGEVRSAVEIAGTAVPLPHPDPVALLSFVIKKPLAATEGEVLAQSLDISGGDNVARAACRLRRPEDDVNGRTEPARTSTDPGASPAAND